MNYFNDSINFGFPFFGIGNEVFRAKYRVYPVSSFPNKANLENGGKILMPPSSLDILTQLHITYPMLFSLTNIVTGYKTHCGVLEFTSDEGIIYIPSWMMNNLGIQQSEIVLLESVSLSVATYAKFEPQTVEFLDVTNPKALLENYLRNFACLTVGDLITIKHGSKLYPLKVISTGEGISAVNIIECDLQVEFDPPPGYVEPTLQSTQEHQLAASIVKLNERINKALTENSSKLFKVFNSSSLRVDGKEIKNSDKKETSTYHRGIPDYNFRIGTITYIRKEVTPAGVLTDEEEKFKVFGGNAKKIGLKR